MLLGRPPGGFNPTRSNNALTDYPVDRLSVNATSVADPLGLEPRQLESKSRTLPITLRVKSKGRDGVSSEDSQRRTFSGWHAANLPANSSPD